jgi:hypothetical protein
MQVLQTAGLPPRTGSRILPASGCTMNNRVAERKIASANSRFMGSEPSPRRTPAAASCQSVAHTRA